MSEPRVRLHDVSVEGDAGHRDAVLAAIERAVTRAVSEGAPSVPAVRTALGSAVRSAVRPGPVTRGGNDAGQDE